NHPDDKVGWAVGVGGIFNTDFISRGDKFSFQFNYAEGATRYVNFTQANAGNAAYAGSGNSFGFGLVTDAVYAATGNGITGLNGGLNLTKVWGVNASYDHVWWDPKWKSSVYGGYNKPRYIGDFTDLTSAAGAICAGLNRGLFQVAAVPVGGASPATACSPNW